MNFLEPKDVVTLVQALAWPAVALIAFIYFRGPLGKLMAELPRRASKITVFDFSIELAKVPQMSTNWSAGGADVRRLTPASMFDSNTSDLIQQISSSGVADYAVIDLGDNKQWLTSRLFLIADLLDRMRSLDCLVFVQTLNTPRPVFIGMAHPRAVRWCLARAYPMFETASMQAYASVFGPPRFPLPPALPGGPVVFSSRGALQISDAANYLRKFLEFIQQLAPIPSPLPPGIQATPPPPGWVELEGGTPVREYAEWLNPQRLNVDLKEVISTASFEDSPDIPKNERVESILRRISPYVALVSRQNFFDGLVDRGLLLETAAANAIQPKTKDQDAP